MRAWIGKEVEGFERGKDTLFVEETNLTEETLLRIEDFITQDCALYFGAAEKRFVSISDSFLFALARLVQSKKDSGILVECVFEMALADVIVFSGKLRDYKIITRIDESLLRDNRLLKIRRGNDIYLFNGRDVVVNRILDDELSCMRYKNDKMIVED